MNKGRVYGYLSPSNPCHKVKMLKGQNISGYPIGILYIEDVWYPMIPGNIVNGYTFDFPVRLKAVKGLNVPKLFRAEKDVLEDLIKAGRELEKEGVRAITAACGFFGNFQRDLVESLDVPVGLSSLIQIPWISTIIKPSQKIGILTADKSSLTDKLLENCGVTNKGQLVVKDMRNEPEFSCILEGRGEFDNRIVKQEIISRALEMVEEDSDIGAVLLECSDMPPYAAAIQREVKLPVFDFTTLIKWLHNSVTQKPYDGFI
ncbi:MAG: aspartate/glutamate racemase family protein [Clostridium sp.]|uniref:aspartate/glutamate racemase family protein n=1 Tax=Clostridium sp. TaxID=1506 RepID=UPI0025BA83BC|nr:aspartate/glutamate racemase family protein [Clostridium sp.]MCH3964441.1 aspartate/glutamate racemase family protein [Clostridium sp.]MCI1715616.1 aspartate/glutamate racemase family protein [Clostridium sp.]MCI1799592.1 aspartate/glutamate racemase family protein [Clostridium sp.]MCI1813800.1 aspartate/glutamate racemase family protein [Clostridium sp.]MCI1870405.1 aspartate/glutamate racemase family protein [Clostridium sp.]